MREEGLGSLVGADGRLAVAEELPGSETGLDGGHAVPLHVLDETRFLREALLHLFDGVAPAAVVVEASLVPLAPGEDDGGVVLEGGRLDSAHEVEGVGLGRADHRARIGALLRAALALELVSADQVEHDVQLAARGTDFDHGTPLFGLNGCG